MIYNMRHKGVPADAVYVGRPKGRSTEHFGNPFSHLINGSKAVAIVLTRKDAVEAFEWWLKGEIYQDVEPARRKWILANLHTLTGKDLVCWCAPLACHAEVLERMANGAKEEG